MDDKTRHSPMEGRIPEETRQHFRAAREELRKSMEGMVPQGFVEHRRRARREMLLAWRSMIDSRLSKLDKMDMESEAEKKSGVE